MSRSFNFATESSNLINFLIRNFKAIFEQGVSALGLQSLLGLISWLDNSELDAGDTPAGQCRLCRI